MFRERVEERQPLRYPARAVQKQHRRTPPGVVQLHGDIPHLEFGQFCRHAVRSLPKHTL